MKQAYPRIMLAAPASGSGKTMITCGLLMALEKRGLACASFKCGPDYIDPMFHKYVLQVPGANLDTYFLEPEPMRELFQAQSQNADLSVIEGVMGYYDGVAGISTRSSSYEIARETQTPVILILDCKGASLSLAAVVKGFLDYKSDHNIKGVLLNRISEAMAERIRPLIEELGVAVIGCLPECREFHLDSRHLGLVMPGEIARLREKLDGLAQQMEKTVDVQALIRLAQNAPVMENREEVDQVCHNSCRQAVRIGVASDQAFCFYYQENLALLRRLGAVLVPFSPIEDCLLPDNLDGILIGGGYPENYARELSQNTGMRESIKVRVKEGLPLLAECGGFLYLHEELEGADGILYPMAGVIPAKAGKTDRLSRFGYIKMSPAADQSIWKKDEYMKGHEFHYWESTAPGHDLTAKKPLSDRNWEWGYASENILAGFPHLYYPSNETIIERWVSLCRKRRL